MNAVGIICLTIIAVALIIASTIVKISNYDTDKFVENNLKMLEKILEENESENKKYNKKEKEKENE